MGNKTKIFRDSPKCGEVKYIKNESFQIRCLLKLVDLPTITNTTIEELYETNKKTVSLPSHLIHSDLFHLPISHLSGNCCSVCDDTKK